MSITGMLLSNYVAKDKLVRRFNLKGLCQSQTSMSMRKMIMMF